MPLMVSSLISLIRVTVTPLNLIRTKNHIFSDSLNCTFRFSDEKNVCDYRFSYELANNRETLLKVQNLQCKEINLIAAGFTIAASIIIGGLLMLFCYRCKIMYDDRKMFAKFEKEREQETKYQMESPLYKSPISNFKVPAEMETSVL